MNAKEIVLKTRILQPNESTLQGALKRVATTCTHPHPEDLYSLRFLPNSPTLMNAGTPLGQLSACFVLPVEDSVEGIFDAIKYTALIHKSGGGVGISLSSLRPEGSEVRGTGGVASGPISFLRVFDAAAEAIKQGGKRRGANMGVLSATHPDILSFIRGKLSGGLTNFNLSVALTGEDLEARPDLLNEVAEASWACGDPGVLFMDTINEHHPLTPLIEAVNPCGEQPLLPYESCNLGSINLTHFTDGTNVLWEDLASCVQHSVEFLDNVIDVNKYPLPQIEEITKRYRKVGLGVMGFADFLTRLSVPYSSEEAVKLAHDVMGFIHVWARYTSWKLGEARSPFPQQDDWISDSKLYHVGDLPDDLPLPDAIGDTFRNATVTTIAPTGTLSILAECTSGIEPPFALHYKRVAVGKEVEESAPVTRWGTCETAHEVSWEQHLAVQQAFQKWTDNAVSKTINLPHDASPQDVLSIYRRARELGLKGVTIYRDGSKEGQTFSSSQDHQILRGATGRIKTGCGKIYVTLNSLEDAPKELFVIAGKGGGCLQAQNEAIGRLASLALKKGATTEELINQLEGIGCNKVGWDGEMVSSCADGIAKLLRKLVGTPSTPREDVCPECGELVVREEGCVKCHSCGWSSC